MSIKKAAIFSKLGQLDHGKFKQCKTAAMFGLDARIALAIFAGLSVITGATLYKTIQEVQVTALLAEMQEVGKAWEQFYLDTGVEIPRNNADKANPHYYIFKTEHLVENSTNIQGWKGPYLKNKIQGFALKHPRYNTIHLANLKMDDGWDDWSGGVCRIAGDKCGVFIMFQGVPKDLAIKIDEKIDGSNSPDSGNIRVGSYGTPPIYEVSLKYAPYKNPND